jgi:hypothetical protein
VLQHSSEANSTPSRRGLRRVGGWRLRHRRKKEKVAQQPVLRKLFAKALFSFPLLALLFFPFLFLPFPLPFVLFVTPFLMCSSFLAAASFITRSLFSRVLSFAPLSVCFGRAGAAWRFLFACFWLFFIFFAL